MKIIEDVVNEKTISRYGKKANLLHVSDKAIIGRFGENSINILRMVKASPSRSFFDNLVNEELDIDRNTDFCHFTLLFGKYMGIYNLYCYEYIDSEVRKKLNSFDDSKSETQYFLSQNGDAIRTFMCYKYGLSEKEYSDFYKCINTVNNDYDYYNSDLVKDFSKIIFGSVLYDNMNSFTSCTHLIDVFNEENNKCLKKIK